MGLMDKAAAAAAPADGQDPAAGAQFEKKDITSAIPPNMRDAVSRIFAAGVKLMYSPDMKDELQQAIQSPDPIPKVLAENVLGMLLTMDQQAGKSGLPPEAIFPAGYELLGEAANVLVQAGKQVTQDDFNTAAQTLYVMIGKKMGAKDEDIMGAVTQVANGQAPAADAGAPTDPNAPPAADGGAVPPAGPPGAPPAAGAPPVDPNAPPPEEDQP